MDQYVNDNTKPSTSAIRAGNGFLGDGVSHRTKRLFAVHGVVTAAAAVIFFGSPPALADPVDMARQHYSKVTRDGWNLDISIQGERINSVPNLAAAVNSREAFVTFSATATATGGSVPITDSVFVAGYQLGCQTDVSSGLQIGGVGSIRAAGINRSTPHQPGHRSFGERRSGGRHQRIRPDYPATRCAIVDLPMSNMALNNQGTAMLDVDNIHIKAEATDATQIIDRVRGMQTAHVPAHLSA
jgi:MspA